VRLASLHKRQHHQHKVPQQNNSIIFYILIISTGRAYQLFGTEAGHGERRVSWTPCSFTWA